MKSMKRKLTNSLIALGAVALGLSAGAAFAGDEMWNFDNPANPTNGFTVVGTHANYYYSAGGNPETGGYLSVADGTEYNPGKALVVVFPDIDQGYPVKAFHLTMDVRAGNGGTERPADGFSISYCREGDPILRNATNGVATGAAGGDDAATATSAAGSSDFENGTKTGVAICFDAWAGNWLPDTGAGGVPGADTEGIEVRVDDKTLTQIDMSADRNGGCSLGTTNDISACTGAVCADFNTEQTGPWVNDGGTSAPLCWAPLDVELDTNKQVTVIWKGHKFLDHYQLGAYTSHRGRLVLMGRTGGNGQNVHFDNIRLTTVPAVEATFGQLVGGPALNQFSFTIDDNGSSVVTNVSLVKLDGADITSKVVFTKSGGTTTGVYTGPDRFVSSSKHTVDITWKTALGQVLSVTPAPNFTTMSWTVLTAAMAVPASSIDLNQPGFRVLSHQVASGQPNRMYWADQQLEGLHGTNYIDYSTLTTINGEIPWTDLIDFGNDASGASGQFAPDRKWSNFGIPGTPLTVEDNSVVSVMAYLYLPQAGTYVMGGNSDDSLRVTVARNSHDLLGMRAQGLFADTGRGISSDENVGALIVDTPGYYGFRMLFENGGGGCALEWYFKSTPSGATNVLVNDLLNNPNTAIKAYQVSSAAPPYVSFADPPLDDDQVYPNQTLKYQLTDGSTTVNSGSVVLKVNGLAQSPTVTKSGGVTTVSQSAPATLWPIGTNTVELSFKDAANADYGYSYTFIVAPYATLTTDLWSAPGSANTPGFRLKAYQSPNTNILNGWKNTIQMANQALNGFYNDNVAVLGSYSHNGEYWESGVINYSENNLGEVTQNGGFQSNSVPSMPDIGFPGLGDWAAPSGVNAGDNSALAAVAYVEFPSAGFYQMGVNSDDGFRVTEGEATNPKSMLSVLAPASIAGDLPAMANIGGMDSSSFGGPLPVPSIVSQAVVCDPIWPASTPNNASALAGKIAILQRDSSGGTATHAFNAQAAGAIAVVIVFADGEGDANQPGVWSGSANVTIPVLTTTHKDGTNLIAHATKDATSPVTLQIGDDASLKLGEDNRGKGSSDVIFGVRVPQAGVYPLRLVWENGGGDVNCEWFTQDPATGVKTLLNAPNSTVKAWISRTVANRPTLSISSQGGVWKISYTGTLQAAPSISGTFTDVQGASSPYSVPTGSAGMQFYRARN